MITRSAFILLATLLLSTSCVRSVVDRQPASDPVSTPTEDDENTSPEVSRPTETPPAPERPAPVLDTPPEKKKTSTPGDSPESVKPKPTEESSAASAVESPAPAKEPANQGGSPGDPKPAPPLEPEPKPVAPTVSPAFQLTFEPATGGKLVNVPLIIEDLTREKELNVEATIAGTSFAVRRYSPSVYIEEKIELCKSGEKGFPAIHLLVKQRARQWESWLVPGSRLLGRSYSMLAEIEAIPEQTPVELLATSEFLGKLYTPEPKILLEMKRDGRRFIFPASVGQVGRTRFPDYRVEVRRLFKSFSMDMKTGDVMDQPGRIFNPALEVVVEHAGESRIAWLFSQLPEFSRGAEDENATLRFVYPNPDLPHPRANITIVDASKGPLTVFAGLSGKLQRHDLKKSDTIQVGIMSLTLVERIAEAKITQSARSASPGRAAVLVAWSAGEKIYERWVPLGVSQELRLENSGLAFIAKLRALTSKGSSPHGAMPGARPKSQSLPAGHPTIPQQQHPSTPKPSDK